MTSPKHGAALMKYAKEIHALGQDREFSSEIKVWLEDESDLSCIISDLSGPAGTPFEGGVFRIRWRLTPEFPEAPPRGLFVTKIYHPNISTAGEICVNTLKKDWHSGVTLRELLLVVRCLLIYPNAESALNEEAGKMLLEDFDAYSRTARLMTGIHAKPQSQSPKQDEARDAVKKENVSPNAADTTKEQAKQQPIAAAPAKAKPKSLRRL